MKTVIVILLVGFLSDCNSKSLYTYKSPNYSEEIKFETVNIRKVLKNPGKYDKKNININGYYKTGFESDAIFKNRQAALNSDGDKAIWLSLDTISEKDYPELSKYSGRYATIKGQYIKGKTGHLGIYNGEIKVYYLEIK